MLAARSVIKRTAAVGPRLARSYATPAPFTLADAAGVKIATAADGSPTGAIAVVLKAGSRFETAPGLAHVLKSAVFKVRRARDRAAMGASKLGRGESTFRIGIGFGLGSERGWRSTDYR